MKEAIQKAIEGGYVNQMIYNHYDNNMISYLNFSYLVFLDPLFWQCLGKSLGWKGEKIRMCVGCGVALKWNEDPTMNGKHGGRKGCGSDIEEYEGQWLIEWHMFIDHLASGKDADLFFKELPQ